MSCPGVIVTVIFATVVVIKAAIECRCTQVQVNIAHRPMTYNPPRQRVGFSNHLRWLIVDAFASSAYADNIIGIARIIVAASAFIIFKEGKFRLSCVGLLGSSQSLIVLIFQSQCEVSAIETSVSV